MIVKGIFLDFGFVIGYPAPHVRRKSRKYLRERRAYNYLDWEGIDTILKDPELTQYLQPNIGRAELEAFFDREIYRVFIVHEQTDGVDPQTNKRLLNRLHSVFDCPINQVLVDKVLTHIDMMKYVVIDAKAVEVVAELKRRGFLLILVSNMMLPGKLLKAKLQEAMVLSYFDHILISSDAGFIKPHPEIFRRALAASKLKPDEVLFVGDTYLQDIIGAQRVGLKTVWLNTRHEPRTMVRDDPPDYEIASLSELLEILAS